MEHSIRDLYQQWPLRQYLPNKVIDHHSDWIEHMEQKNDYDPLRLMPKMKDNMYNKEDDFDQNCSKQNKIKSKLKYD